MEDKYYVPQLEEFHMGFEYEYLDRDDNWVKATPTEITREDFEHQTYGLRVKYLNKKDIESLGWKSIDTDTFKFDCTKDVYWEMINDEMRGSILIRLQCIDEDFEASYWNKCFSGKIKNKSELKVLMKQLGIYENNK